MGTTAAMKTYRTAEGWQDIENGYESLQVRVEFQAEMSEDGWRPPYRLRNVDRTSASGFAWGYGGGGPSALAWSLLWDALADVDEDLADLAVTDFVRDLIVPLDKERAWELRQQDIQRWFEAWKRRPGNAEGMVQSVLRRRVTWALRQVPVVDREMLLALVMRDLREAPAVRDLESAWDLGKLEVAAWVNAWLRSHPEEVADAGRLLADRLADLDD
jgi:Family of unknown function (DUF6166)